MNASKGPFGLAVGIVCVLLSLCEMGETATPKSQKSFNPGWQVVRAQDGRVRRLIAKKHHWDSRALSDLEGLDSLEVLDLSGTTVKDNDLRMVTPLAGLKTLDLSDTQITDAGLKHLVEMKKLKRLITHRSRVTEKGLVALESLRPGFEAVRLWDIIWEEFDHGLLLQTPRFNMIQDFPYIPSDLYRNSRLQISGPELKTCVRSLPPRDGRKPNFRGRRDMDFRFTLNIEPGDQEVTSVEICKTTFDITDPARTYVIDGKKRIRPADVSLRFDEKCWTWIETGKPVPPTARGEQNDTPRNTPRKTSRKRPSVEVTARARTARRANDPSPSANMLIRGEWNGKLIWGLAKAATPIPHALGYIGPGTARPNARLTYRSDAGIVFIFRHFPAIPIWHTFRRGGTGSGNGANGLGPTCYCVYYCGSPQPARRAIRSVVCFNSPPCHELMWGTTRVLYSYKMGCCLNPFGSSCRVTIPAAHGRNVYWSSHARPLPPNPDWAEFAERQWNETLGFAAQWPDLRVEKHGWELVSPVCVDRKKKKAEMIDCFGRRHIIEEQRFDLHGPKKTFVLDVYGRLRILSPEDEKRIMETRRRDYLDNGDPSPAGPVAPVSKKR